MKLELKHLSAYLPYNVNLKSNEGRISSVMTGIQYPYIECTLEHNIADHISNFSLILRPLSDLAKEIEVNGEKFVPIRKLKTGGTNNESVSIVNDWDGINYVCSDNESHELRFSAKSGFDQRYNCESRQIYAYDLFQKLFEWHFDVFSLIEAGLAVDINTVLV